MSTGVMNTGVVTATVTAGTEATGGGGTPPTAKDFLLRVVPWPVNQVGHVNLHYSMVNQRGGKNIVTGKPFQDIDQLLSFCNWAESTNNIKELWYCTSMQSQTGTNTKGRVKAVRLKQNAMFLKAIWVDVDVKDDPNHYKTIGEAWDAIRKFRADAGLPQFSAVVSSGGGLHIYWISKTPLTPDVWQHYADGLKALLLKHGVKCDAGLTGDSARILRIPGTLNHKYDPPRRVRLLELLERDYDFDTTLAFLTKLGPTAKPSLAAPNTFSDPAVFAGKTPILPLDGTKLSDGIKPPHVLLDPKPIFKQCGFLQDALFNGGKDYDNPLWNLTLLCATFMENGNGLAHEMSKGHAQYTFAETQTQYERKVAERQSRGLGYPSCATIRGENSTACTTCPLFKMAKSPLNIRPDKKVTATVTTAHVKFRDLDKFGQPRPTLANAVIAIRSLGIEARLDLFHNRTTVSYGGTSKTIREGLLTDQTVSAVRSLINNTYQIDCGEPNTFAAINETARENTFDPVLDLLDHCQGEWDGVKRLDTWVIDYLGCEDTPLNRAIGRSVLVAACRRARFPGCKFDFITVLEGPEGVNKSTAIRVLAGDDNFNDQSILGASDKEVQEQLEGTWMHENADLAGMKRADVEQVKAFASRQVDRARPAYGRVREDRPRRSIEWATTNNDTYLLSQTGNRRWWTLKTGKIDIEALKRDHEQLLGEAAAHEAAGESIGLDESLWGDAREAQEQRRVADPWEDIVAKLDNIEGIVHRLGDGFERVFSADVLRCILDIPTAQQTSQHSQRLAHAMQHAGWGRSQSGRITVGGVTLRGYIRRVPFSVAQRLVHAAMGVKDPPPLPVRTGICD